MAMEAEMAQWLHTFWLAEEGQDTVEYALLLTFICFTAAAFVFSGTAYVNGIWIKENTVLVSANTVGGGN